MRASIPSPPEQWAQFPLGPLTVHAYALCIIAGIVAATLILGHRLKRRGIDLDGRLLVSDRAHVVLTSDTSAAIGESFDPDLIEVHVDREYPDALSGTIVDSFLADKNYLTALTVKCQPGSEVTCDCGGSRRRCCL